MDGLVANISIEGCSIGSGSPCFIIAEAGVNHNGSLGLAYQLVDMAVHAGADAVKFQTFQAELLVTRDAPKAEYQIRNTGGEENQFQMLKKLELSAEANYSLRNYCKEKGILFLSTPFDEKSADLLEQLNVPLFKIGSGEVTNLPFLRYVARKQKPIILSTGMSTLGEVETAIQAIVSTGNSSIILLHCVSVYPAPSADINLRVMQTLQSTLGFPAGYSDHTIGIEISLAAAALGACVIEKHITLDRRIPGPDQSCSIEPTELRALVTGVRNIEAALGNGIKRVGASELNTARIARKSLVAACDIPESSLLSEEMIATLRPGTGIPPGLISFLIGRTTRVSIQAGTLLSLEMFT